MLTSLSFILPQGIPTLVNRHDRNYEIILKDVKEKVKQASGTGGSLLYLPVTYSITYQTWCSMYLHSNVCNLFLFDNRSLCRHSPCLLWPESCTPTVRCVRPCPRWKWLLVFLPWLGENLTCSCPATWRRFCRWETRWLRISSRSANRKQLLFYPAACLLTSVGLPVWAVLLFFNANNLPNLSQRGNFILMLLWHNLTPWIECLFVLHWIDDKRLFCLQALSMCCLKHCVVLWQLLASLKSENMLIRLKRVRHHTTLPIYRHRCGNSIVY